MGMRSPSCRPSAAAELVEGALSLDEALAAVRSPARGGISVFLGDVRGIEDGAPIDAIVYEAFPEMALPEMEKIASEAAERWGAAVAVRHRTGPVPAGETAFIVAAAAGHRPEAFAACRFVVDEVKARAAVWKARYEAAS